MNWDDPSARLQFRHDCCVLVAALVRKERRKRDLKQGAVARRLGVKQSWLSRLETGKRGHISMDEFLVLAEAIGFDAVKAYRKISSKARKAAQTKDDQP